jgi:5-methylcytosine-specific restriction endonuclease McrA
MTGRRFDYSSQAWKDLRKAALRRDRWRCIQCGERRRLTVDHIQPARTHPHMAWRIENLRTLCGSCDNKRHREKGHAAHGRTAWGCDELGRPLDPAHPWNRALP